MLRSRTVVRTRSILLAAASLATLAIPLGASTSPGPGAPSEIRLTRAVLEPVRFRWRAHASEVDGSFILAVEDQGRFETIARMPAREGTVDYRFEWHPFRSRSQIELRFQDRSGREWSLSRLVVLTSRSIESAPSAPPRVLSGDFEPPGPLLLVPDSMASSRPETTSRRAGGLERRPPTPPPRQG